MEHEQALAGRRGSCPSLGCFQSVGPGSWPCPSHVHVKPQYSLSWSGRSSSVAARSLRRSRQRSTPSRLCSRRHPSARGREWPCARSAAVPVSPLLDALALGLLVLPLFELLPHPRRPCEPGAAAVDPESSPLAYSCLCPFCFDSAPHLARPGGRRLPCAGGPPGRRPREVVCCKPLQITANCVKLYSTVWKRQPEGRRGFARSPLTGWSPLCSEVVDAPRRGCPCETVKSDRGGRLLHAGARAGCGEPGALTAGEACARPPRASRSPAGASSSAAGRRPIPALVSAAAVRLTASCLAR